MAEFYIGEIRMTAGLSGNQPPYGWLFCDGSLVSISNYQALFALIRTYYGGDGATNFGLPDYRSRLPLSIGLEVGAPSPTTYTIGMKGGLEQVPLSGANIPGHTHLWYGSNKTADKTTAQNNMFGTVPIATSGPAYGGLYENSGATGFNWYNVASTVIGNAGTPGATHENRMPSQAVAFMIAYMGVYPVQG